MESLLRDLRYGLRTLRKSPGFAAVAVLVLGLGTGANTAIFSLANGIFLRPPPVNDPGRLVWVMVRVPFSTRPQDLSYPDYLDLRDRNQIFTDLVAGRELPLALSDGGVPERTRGEIVSGNYFSALGVKMALGRSFSREEDQAPGDRPIAVVSHALWRRRFGSDPGLPGRTVTLNGQPFTVIGVAPEGFSGLEIKSSIDIWVPAAVHAIAAPAERNLLTWRDATWFRVFGRLRPDVSPAQARSGLRVLGAGIVREHPGFHDRMEFSAAPLSGAVHVTDSPELVPIGLLLSGVAGFVLLIACGNVAGLLLGRGVTRRREIGIRLAMGATRRRLVRQLLSESLLLALLGAAAGLLLSAWAMDLFVAFAEIPPEVAGAARPDGRVLVYALTLAVVTALVCGLAPAWTASRFSPGSAIKDEPGLSGRCAPRARLQSLLAMAQVALSVVLLVGAGLFLRSLGKMASVDPGFQVRHGLAVSFDLNLQGYPKERAAAFREEVLERVESLPGVRAASLAGLVPLSGKLVGAGASKEGDASPTDMSSLAFMNTISPGYFRTLGIPLRRGRDFTREDREGAPDVVIVNETLARSFWPGEEPLGKRISLSGPRGPFLEVVGVARDSKYDELSEAPRPFAYLPYLQSPDLIPESTLLARTDGAPSRHLATIRTLLQRMDPQLPLFGVATLEQVVRQRIDKQRGVTSLLGLSGTLAVVVAFLGLYGAIAFSVAWRTREIGIRMALGAAKRQILGMFVREGIRLSLPGIAVGLVLAAGLTRLLTGMLFGITPTDLVTFAGVALLLAGVSALAGYVPARRAARVDPMIALRCE